MSERKHKNGDREKMKAALEAIQNIGRELTKLVEMGVISRGQQLRFCLKMSYWQAVWFHRSFGISEASAFMKEAKAEKAKKDLLKGRIGHE